MVPVLEKMRGKCINYSFSPVKYSYKPLPFGQSMTPSNFQLSGSNDQNGNPKWPNNFNKILSLDISKKSLKRFNFRMGLRWARLRNWRIGRTYPLRPQSRVIQWLLSAQWYNWSWEDRYDIIRDVEASNVVWLTPTRLGVNLRFSCLVHGDKRHANIFIGLYDRRIITPELFRVQTYKSWFQDFARNIDDEGKVIVINIS